MDDLQLNITVSKKPNKKVGAAPNNAAEYKFVSKKQFSGHTVARKRPQNAIQKKFNLKNYDEGPAKKFQKVDTAPSKSIDLAANLRDLSENKGKYEEKNYQAVIDELSLKQKPRSGGWISSLFKNNPDVPRMGQRAVKPVVEKVFAGTTFSDLDIHPHSVANLQQNLKLKELMTVQQSAVPVILQGRDVLIRSQTGSGKTLAYALPIIEALQAIRPKINRHEGIRVIVVVPTRELAMQTDELFTKLVKPFHWIVPGLLSGGQKRKAEKARLRKGISILVGTPGRINDHLRHTHSMNFAKTGCLVLDEADRLLDMGYEKDVAAIVRAIEDHKKAATYDPMALMKQNVNKKIPEEEEIPKVETKEETDVKHRLTEVFLSKERQTILLSATLTKAVENLAGITMVDPVFVDTSEGRAVVADSLKLQPVNKLDNDVTKNIDTNDKKAFDKAANEKKHKIKEDSKGDDNELNESIDIVKNNKEIEVEVKKGLKAFTGLNHLDLFDNKESTKSESKVDNQSNTKPVLTANNNKTAEDSDSDSDYEYFKVQKEIESKQEINKEEHSEEEDTEVPVTNTFAEAVKSALVEDELVLPATVNQTFLIVPMKLRLVTLCSLIVEHCVLNKKGGKMIVFMATLEMVDYFSELIETVLTGKDAKAKKKEKDKKKGKAKKRKPGDAGEEESSSDSEFEIDYQQQTEGGLVPMDIEMFSLHGSMPHEQRMEVFKQFRTARCGIMICTVIVTPTTITCIQGYRHRCGFQCRPLITYHLMEHSDIPLPKQDVAARGIDVPRVDLVLQFCAPASATDYVHRVGRTGRAAQVGAAVMFLLPSEAEFVRYLEQKRIRLKQKDESQVLEPLRSVCPAAASPQRAAIAVQTRLEATAHSDRDWLARASRAYTSWVRFYSGYPRDVRPYLDAKSLHLGHAAKAFALRDTPAALARRAKADPDLKRDKPVNRLTVRDEDEKKRPGFPKVKLGFTSRVVNKQSSMHTASEFDSGLPPLEQARKKKKLA